MQTYIKETKLYITFTIIFVSRMWNPAIPAQRTRRNRQVK